MKRFVFMFLFLVGLITYLFHNLEFLSESVTPSVGIYTKDSKLQGGTLSRYKPTMNSTKMLIHSEDSSSGAKIDLQVIFKSLSKRQYEVGATDRRKKDLLLIEAFKSEQWTQLASILTDASTSPSDKRIASYLLSLAGPESIPALVQIITSPFRINFNEDANNVDFAYRLGALENLDILAVQNLEAQKVLRELDTLRIDQSLRFFLSVSQMGLQQNRPGKLHRLISKRISEI